METDRTQSSAEITDPDLEGISDETLETLGDEIGPEGLNAEQLAARVAIKRQQAAQDAGWTVPPGMGADVEPLPEEEEKGEEEPEEEPDEADEGEEAPEEGEEPEEAEEDEEAEEPEDYYVSGYKTREAAEAGLAEKDRTIDRLFKELEDTRRGRAAEAEEAEQQPLELDVNAWNQWAAEAVEEGAGPQGAMAALEQGGPGGYDIYVAHWLASEEPGERARAIAFNNEVQRQLAPRYAVSALGPLIAERQRQDKASEAQMAKQAVAERHPDFAEMEEKMDELVKSENGLIPPDTREWLAGLAESGLEGKVRAWEYLYMAASAASAPTRRRASEVEKKRRRASADRAKVAASVSSSEGTQTRTPPPASELAVIRKKNALRNEWGLPLLEEN
jgi:hypothetical protein